MLLEAMSYGKCCVCSDIDENLEVIEPPLRAPSTRRNGETPAATAPIGVRFKSEDVADLAKTLRSLLDDPAVHSIRPMRAHTSRSISTGTGSPANTSLSTMGSSSADNECAPAALRRLWL